jgi:cysteine-rich repeat protein
VREGDEECDDGDTTGNEDACLNSCENASCGDGYVQEGVEECDTAAPPEGAVCVECQLAAASCGADGLVTATVEIQYDPMIDPQGTNLPGTISTRVDYPDFLEVPGSADSQQTLASVSDLTDGVSFLVNDDDSATAVAVNYVDANGGSPPSIKYESIYRVQFQDCPLGRPLRPQDFPCTTSQVSDEFGFPILGVTCRVVALAAAGSPPTTSSTSTSTSSTSSSTSNVPTTTVTTTTSTTLPHLCGNGTVEGPETCEDVPPNTVNADGCPADCIVDPCSQTANPGGVLTVSIVNNESGQTTFGVVTVFIDYPEGKVLVPGTADDSQVQAAVTDRPTTGSPTCLPNDRDHGLQFGCLSTSGFNEGVLFRINHRDCGNLDPPAEGEFNCQILEATDTIGFPVSATCTLSYAP